MRLLVLNCGSSTVKYGFYDIENPDPDFVAGGLVEVSHGHEAAIAEVLKRLPGDPDAVIHRVVHGGERHYRPVRLTRDVEETLQELADLAPLHNPPALAGVEAMKARAIPQMLAFDTAFHRDMPPHAAVYALPVELAKRLGIRRYGFHGLSYQSILHAYTRMTGVRDPSLVILHLGNGASAAAVRHGRCIDTSMGMTPLEGLPMGTRPGDMDPAIVPHLLKSGLSLEETERLLWRESGLFGLAGNSDMRELLARDDEPARLAVEFFCYRVRKTLGAYLAAVGDAEAVVFTGGIGQNAAPVRARVLAGLERLGIHFDAARNRSGGPRLTFPESPVQAFVLPAEEERMMALLARDLLLEIPSPEK